METLRILFLGDVVGEPGRKAVIQHLAEWRERHAIDFVVANGENAAGGRGITPKIAIDLLRAGVASAPPAQEETAPPGAVVAIDRDRLLVRCGGKALLEISELRFAGRKSMNVREAVNGRLIEAGEIFAAAASS